MYTLMGRLWKRRKKTIVKVNLIYFVVHLFTTYSVWSLLVWIIFHNILKQSDLIKFLIFTWICIQKTPVSWKCILFFFQNAIRLWSARGCGAFTGYGGQCPRKGRWRSHSTSQCLLVWTCWGQFILYFSFFKNFF